jgi:methylated-DNA-[protein]-cysteine S-methyltransferase
VISSILFKFLVKLVQAKMKAKVLDGEFTTFPTVFGHCAIAWSLKGIAAVHLPHRSLSETQTWLLHKLGNHRQWAFQKSPPSWIVMVIEQIGSHLAGILQDFSAAELDFGTLSGFRRQVYQTARNVPCGQTITYGQLANLAGFPKAARAVGQAMAHNRFALIVPCHRVIAAGLKLGGFSAFGGMVTKQALLTLESSSPRAQNKAGYTLTVIPS